MTFKSNIVFFTFDGAGHVNPILSIAKELLLRGHKVSLVTPENTPILERVKALGIDTHHCLDISSRINEADMQKRFEFFRKSPLEAFKIVYSVNGALDKKVELFRHNYAKIEQKLRSLSPDLIIVDHIVGLPLAITVAKKWIRIYSGFPSILFSSFNNNYVGGLGVSPRDVTPDMKKTEIELKMHVLDNVFKLFKDNNVSTWNSNIDLVPTSPFINFYLGPAELGLEQEKHLKPLPDYWLRLEHTIVIDENCKPFDVPEKLLNLPGKLIYFSLGTLVNCDYDLIKRLLDIFSKSPNRFIVSLGPHANKLPTYANIWGQEFINQKSVLQSVDLFVSHGGHNSIIEAFYFGVPLIVTPIFADQFDAAQRVQDCNYGYRLNAFETSEKEFLETIDKALNNDELRNKFLKASKRMQSIRYDLIAVDKIETVLSL